MTHFRWLRALAAFGGLGLRLNADDTLYCCLPLYHNNALTVAVSSVINAGATLALGEKFSASRFWDEVIALRATAFIYIGELCGYLLNQPPKPTDRAHKVRVIAGNGLRPGDLGRVHLAIRHRAGVRVLRAPARATPRSSTSSTSPRAPASARCRWPMWSTTPTPARRCAMSTAGSARCASGQPGLLISPVNRLSPFDGYTDKAASEKKLVRDAFSEGDVWFNTGDVMNPQGMRHAAFADRLGDTFRWKGENVATTQVEAALASRHAGRGVHRVRCRGPRYRRPGRHGGDQVALTAPNSTEANWPRRCTTSCRRYAIPLFIRVVDSLEHTSTFKSRKVDLREQAYGSDDRGPAVRAGRTRDEGYVPFHDEYPEEVAAGQRPKG